ncbi:acetyl-CoA carboxylase biotin carboxyl carrier protein, partial [Streptomyces sp. YC537]|nr:acetyl-CoA carboxylase biotin carboxyl carrier protein [Streptomyces boluensis]
MTRITTTVAGLVAAATLAALAAPAPAVATTTPAAPGRQALA